MIGAFSVIGVALVAGVSLYFLRRYFQGGICRSNARLEGKTVVITGCNTGIGKETALDMARRGARVVMACRNVELANAAACDIRQKDQNANIVVYRLDLADLSSVRDCALKINQLETRIDILVNNAGIMMCDQMKTKDGFEMQMGTNHFGHFLFTKLLLEKIKASAPSRIVTVSSHAQFFAKRQIDLDDINIEKREYNRLEAYALSKLANVLFTRELAKRLRGTGVTTYALHPGSIDTELARHLEKWVGSYLFQVGRLFGLFFLKTPFQGAQTSIFCAVDESVTNESGNYYSDCKLAKASKFAKDEEVARKLWDLSEKYVKL